MGKRLIDAYPHLKDSETHRRVTKVFETGEQVEIRDYELQTADGNTKFINYILKPLNDTDGNTEYVISVGFDVTEEVLTKRKLKVSEQQFRDLANSIPQLVWKSHPNGYTYYYNDKWYEYTGLPRDEFGDGSWLKAVRPEQHTKIFDAWCESIKTGKDYNVEYELIDKDNPGQYRWFLGQAIPIKNEKEEIIEWLGTCTDIHEIKLLQAQKDNFLGIASHELKTPLTSLKLYCQVLEKSLIQAGDEKNAGLAVKMDEQVNRLSSLIADLLDVTKIQNGRLQFNEEAFDFNDLVTEVVNEIQMSTAHKIDTRLKDVGIIFGDKARIAQVINNLINNGIKYSPDADRIIVESRLVNGKATLSVEDFGIGLDEDKHEKVFEQYYRVSGSDQHTFPGLGLGLYISSEIVRRTGGRIWVNSIPQKGSTFCFEIPKHKSETGR